MESARTSYTANWLKDTVADGRNPANADEHGLISCLYRVCLAGFKNLCDNQFFDLDSKQTSRNVLARLFLWGEGVQIGKLDQALVQSEDVRRDTIQLLASIGTWIARAQDCCKYRAFSFPQHICRPLTITDMEQSKSTTTHVVQQASGSLTSLLEQAKSVTMIGDEDPSIEDDESSSSEASDLDDSAQESSSTLCNKVDFDIRCLMELSATLRQNISFYMGTDERISPQTTIAFSVSDPARSYVALIQEKFKQADANLVQRLGEANWQRHIRVRQQTAQETDDEEPVHVEEPISVFKPHSTFHDSGIGTTVASKSQYTHSHTSFRSSHPESETCTMRVPPTPAEMVAGKPFQCQICNKKLSNIKHRVDWK